MPFPPSQVARPLLPRHDSPCVAEKEKSREAVLCAQGIPGPWCEENVPRLSMSPDHAATRRRRAIPPPLLLGRLGAALGGTLGDPEHDLHLLLDLGHQR